MCRAHRPFADRTSLDIGGTADFVAVITRYRVRLTERFITYRANDGVCSAEWIFADETLSKVFVAERIGTLVACGRMFGAVRRLAR